METRAWQQKQQMRERLEEILERTRTALAAREPLFAHLGEPVAIRQQRDKDAWWFLGDVHGDFFALSTLLEHVLRAEPEANICFLGDIVDRGIYGVECVALVLLIALERPGKVIWIAGNHDEGVYRDDSGHYQSRTQPGEFSTWLNDGGDDSLPATLRALTGDLFIEVVAQLPRAVLFGDGLLALHGGVPLSDRWPSLRTFGDLLRPEMLQDFVWTRATDTPRKLVNRNRQGCEYGWRDLEGFVSAVSGFFPIKRVIRGHDHVHGGWEQPKGYTAVPLLTLNTFGFDYIASDTIESAAYREALVAARQHQDALPEVVAVPWTWGDRRPFENHRLQLREELPLPAASHADAWIRFAARMDDAEYAERKRRRAAQWQRVAKMEADLSDLELRSSSLDGASRKQAWTEFLRKYERDVPGIDRDDALRAKAKQFWRSARDELCRTTRTPPCHSLRILDNGDRSWLPAVVRRIVESPGLGRRADVRVSVVSQASEASAADWLTGPGSKGGTASSAAEVKLEARPFGAGAVTLRVFSGGWRSESGESVRPSGVFPEALCAELGRLLARTGEASRTGGS